MIYLLTSGCYSDFRDCGLVTGPVNPETLIPEFMAAYQLPKRAKDYSHKEWAAHYEAKNAATDRARGDFPEAKPHDDAEAIFLLWLKRRGFEDVEYEGAHLGDHDLGDVP